MWFVNNIQKIIRWVNAVLDSLGNVAAGAISAAIGFIVNGMKIIIPVILDFFARLLNISGIVDAVKKIIDKIAAPIHAAITKVIDWVVGWVKKMFGKGDTDTKKAKKPNEENVATNGEHAILPKEFVIGSEKHTLFFENGELMMATNKTRLDTKLSVIKTPENESKINAVLNEEKSLKNWLVKTKKIN